MDSAQAIERLDRYHQRIEEDIVRAEALLETDPDEAGPALARLRWGLARLLREYQLFKHTEIFDPVIASAARRPAAIATEMKRHCVDANALYAEHVVRWSMSDVAADWEAYRVALRAIMATIRTHLARERAGTQAILAGRPRTRDGRVA